MSILRSRAVLFLLRKLRLPNDPENVKTTIENIRAGAYMSGVSLWVLAAAIFIASLGLNTNSTAVIIGAMLISPLMGPIMGFGLGLGINDFSLVKKSIRNFVVAVVISIVVSTIYFAVSPVKEAGSELLARTSPTLYDVLIAFFGGIAGIIAGASVLRRSNVIPGVAIATALMPPLCTVGYGLANVNIAYAFGALYLFLINSVFISIATYLIVRLLDYPRVSYEDVAQRRRMVWIISGIVLLMIVPSTWLTYHIVKKYVYQRSAEQFIREQVQDNNHVVVSSKLDYKPGRSKLELVMMGEIIDSSRQAELAESMRRYDLDKCSLVIYQGTDSRAATEGMFNELSSGIRLQRTSIQDLYLRVDSLSRELSQVHVADTLQASLANAVSAIDSSLVHLTLQHHFSYNPSKKGIDTLWTVMAGFRDILPKADRSRLDSLFKARLRSPYITLLLE